MVKHIKKAYSKDGNLTDKEKSIAYATAWKHHNKESVEDIKQRLQAKSNRVKDAAMAKKMNKVLFRHRTNEQKLPMIGPGLEPPYNAVDAKRFDVKKKKDKKWDSDKQNLRPRQPQTMGEDAR